MKKKSLSILLFLSLIFSSCTQDNINNETSNKSYELSKQITLTETTTYVSPLFFNMGVTKIKVKNIEDSVIYEFNTEKEFGINKEFINLSDFAITLKNDVISINSNPNLSLTIFENSPYIITPTFSGHLNSENVFDNKEINILLLFMKEMITEIESKIDSNQTLNSNSRIMGCSFWNTYYVYSTGGNLSVAEDGLADEIAYYSSGFNTLSVEGCSTIGGVNTSCLWGEHACVASQAFCCN